MKQKYVDLAKKILSEGVKIEERTAMEDELVELAYQIAGGFELTPEDFDKTMSDKREKNGGFEMGYLYSEKVLPIGEGSNENKVKKDDSRDVINGVYKEVEKANEWGIKKIPEKLVRDNIPAITEAMAKKNYDYLCAKNPKILSTNNPLKDYKAKVRIANPVEMKNWLRNKLEEESKEFLTAEEKIDIVEDLGDVLEIVETYTARY
jgi:predicted house-cleaning noncanonical NTP pyrophosphatase (MazG superfamily)